MSSFGRVRLIATLCVDDDDGKSSHLNRFKLHFNIIKITYAIKLPRATRRRWKSVEETANKNERLELDQDMKESNVNIGGGLFRPHRAQPESQQIKQFVIK